MSVANYTVEVITEQDDMPVRGNALASGDHTIDRECEDEILARLDQGDIWAWALVTVRATCDECGAEGSATMGCCSFEDESEFTGDSGYYDDMRAEAYEAMWKGCTCWQPTGVGSERCEVES